ncbi:hypothetical protein E308F_16370 [Moorella sp. E308F]|nr:MULTISPECIES: helix-turn-helix domain-containing protein [unclassified Moorella (in: firmicutes)]GEA15393.1 hypothetical protein E308F_16370 [Moorella sp. E308F]GEA19747.1 hypothetical protein E306M_28860 [Moorella sp. E306M]
MIEIGELPAAKIGNRYRIAQEDLEQFIEERRTVKEGVSNIECLQG